MQTAGVCYTPVVALANIVFLNICVCVLYLKITLLSSVILKFFIFIYRLYFCFFFAIIDVLSLTREEILMPTETFFKTIYIDKSTAEIMAAEAEKIRPPHIPKIDIHKELEEGKEWLRKRRSMKSSGQKTN